MQRVTAGRPRSFSSDELDTRVRLAAAEEFSRQGYDAATVDAIVAASGVSKPALYRAFGSKSRLYCTLLERFATDLAATAMRSFGNQRGSGEMDQIDQFRLIIDSWFGVLEERPDEWKMLNTATSTDPQVRATLERLRSMQLRNDVIMIRTFLPELPEGEVEPIAEAIRGSLIAIGTWWLANRHIDRNVAVNAMTRLCAGLFAVTTAAQAPSSSKKPVRPKRR